MADSAEEPSEPAAEAEASPAPSPPATEEAAAEEADPSPPAEAAAEAAAEAEAASSSAAAPVQGAAGESASPDAQSGGGSTAGSGGGAAYLPHTGVGGSGSVGALYDDAPIEPRIALLPRYALPNITSMLPEYANHEQDTIRRAFQSANCEYAIQHLPNEMYTHEVNRARALMRQDVRSKASPHAPAPGEKSNARVTNTHGLFGEFAYEDDPIERQREMTRAERLAGEAHRLTLHPETGGRFVPAGNVLKGQYEEGFEEGATYPYSMSPYEAYEDDALRAKWMEEAKVLYGAFAPNGTTKPLGDRPTKAMAREVIDAVASVVAQDWEGVLFDVHANDEEHWVFRFQADTVDSEAGLLTYMNLMLRCNDQVLKHGLRKVVDGWNVRNGDHIHFTFAPPWAERNAMGKAWYQLHPEESKYAGPSWLSFQT